MVERRTDQDCGSLNQVPSANAQGSERKCTESAVWHDDEWFIGAQPGSRKQPLTDLGGENDRRWVSDEVSDQAPPLVRCPERLPVRRGLREVDSPDMMGCLEECDDRPTCKL